MRIGILTFHSALNCGAVLQAYALQNSLEKMGHKVEFINYREIRKKNIRDFIGKGILKTWYKLEDIIQSSIHRKNDAFGSILKIGKTNYYSLSELQSNPPEYDVYIAGSDQIWNLGSKSNLNRIYYLDFGSKKIKRIAFAASFGQCNIPSFLNEEIRAQLLKFHAISVRELNGFEYIQSIVGDKKEIHLISDPTILLNANDYLKIANSSEIKSARPYIASYILHAYGLEQLNIVDYIKTKLGVSLINLRNPETCIRLPRAKNKVINPYQWLRYVYDAQMIICCSFHAVVFSLIFHKEFVVVSPYVNQRILSLLTPLNLNYRCINKFDTKYINQVIEQKIDWQYIDEKITEQKKTSLDFIISSLK